MSVRFKIALTIFVTGALTALGVIATVLLAFQRFEHETAYHRADLFLGRVVGMYDSILDMHTRKPEEFKLARHWFLAANAIDKSLRWRVFDIKRNAAILLFDANSEIRVACQ